jgi:hypothetical protein
VTDAVGHDVDSALTATLCIGSPRNTRRHGATLLEQAESTNEALLANGCGPEGEGVATALLGRLELRTGRARARQRRPHRALPGPRRHGRPARAARGPPARALRAHHRPQHHCAPARRRPCCHRDRRDARAGSSEFGPWRTHPPHCGSHPREATRELADLVIAASGGELADDAVPFVLDWLGDHGQPGHAVAGADAAPARA